MEIVVILARQRVGPNRQPVQLARQLHSFRFSSTPRNPLFQQHPEILSGAPHRVQRQHLALSLRPAKSDVRGPSGMSFRGFQFTSGAPTSFWLHLMESCSRTRRSEGRKMTVLATFLLFLALMIAPSLHAQSDVSVDSGFRIEIQTVIDGKPSFTFTNLFNDTLTACVIRFYLSSRPTWHAELDWDPLVQDLPINRVGAEPPFDAGTSKTMYLPHAVGESLPDKV